MFGRNCNLKHMANAVCVIFFLGLVRYSGACEESVRGINTFGPDCKYMCHCVDNDACNVVTGECTNGCEPGWFGPGCQFRDLAYKELSRHNSNMVAFQYADKGNDGDTRTCSYTNNASLSVSEPWWRVWLPRNETINELIILTNDDGKGYFSSFTVTVEYVPEAKRDNGDYAPGYRQICHQTTSTITKTRTIHVLCGKHLVGNHIRIQLNQVNAQLVLCGVRINGGRNIAFASYVTVSSNSSNISQRPNRAVDGDLTDTWTFCFASLLEKNSWFRVDLGREMYITFVNITKLSDNRLQGYFIRVSNTSNNLITVYDDSQNDPPTTQVSLNVTTRYIELKRPGIRLVICELQIFGNCPPNKCGYGCTEECHCKGSETLENKINGVCATGCDGRWTGINDSCYIECAYNQWGETCSEECGACKDSTCDVKTGKCPNGCQIGHYDTDICTQECDDGTYGMNCSRNCNTTCEDICNKVNGSCTCLPGWTGNFCGMLCDDGTYGSNCNGICSVNCLDACNNEDGTCVQCDPGWTGDLCQEACQSGFYGHKCEQACSVNCEEQLCHQVNGSCTNECTAGWQGDICDEECDAGRYGEGCKGICIIHCRATCNNVNGTCALCDPGWVGDFCEKQCESGMYGSNCVNKCGFCQKSTTCDKVTGICPSGCIDGFDGGTCDQVESTHQDNTITIAGSVVAGIIVICITVIIIVRTIMKRNQPLRNTIQDNNDEHINDPTSLPYEDLQENCLQNDTEGTYESIVQEEISL